MLLVCAATLQLGCERHRLDTQVETDLGLTFTAVPDLLYSETYGSAEEGGDRALLRIEGEDCVKVGALLDAARPSDPRSHYYRMFKAEGLDPPSVQTKYMNDPGGDWKLYALDNASCVLFRQAHFE